MKIPVITLFTVFAVDRVPPSPCHPELVEGGEGVRG